MRAPYLADRRGAAAVEVALWLGILTPLLLNVLDLGFYAFQAIQVREAAQVAAQAALTTCVPATSAPVAAQCSGLSAALTSAAQSTSLGTGVTVSTASTATFEGYYCGNKTGGLTATGATWAISSNTSTSPGSCSGTVSGNTDTASDYIAVNVTYTYHALFPNITVTSILPSTISQTAWMRLN